MNIEAARDSILSHFNAYWTANSAAVNGGKVPEMKWDNLDGDAKPVTPSNAPYGRAVVRHAVSPGQQTLGEPGNRLFGRVGVVLVQLFVPLASGLTLADRLSKIAADAFEGKSTVERVLFRNVSVIEAGAEKGWFQYNVSAAFEYDELK